MTDGVKGHQLESSGKRVHGRVTSLDVRPLIGQYLFLRNGFLIILLVSLNNLYFKLNIPFLNFRARMRSNLRVIAIW